MLTRLLVTYLRPYSKLLTGALMLQIVGVVSGLILPSMNADLIDYGVAVGDIGHIWHVGFEMTLVTAAQAVSSFIAAYWGAKAAMAAGRDLRADLVRHVGNFSGAEYGQFGVPTLITRTTNDVVQIQMLVVISVSLLVTAPIMGIGAVVMAVIVDPGTSWIIVATVPFLAISMGFLIWKMIPGFRIVQQKIDTLNRVLREQISGIRVVRAFVQERHELARFGRANHDLTGVSLKVANLGAVMFPAVLIIATIASCAVLWFGGHRVAAGQGQIGSLSALLSYLISILISVMMVSFLAMTVPRASVCADRICEVLDTEVSVRRPVEPQPFLREPAHIEFNGAEFGYAGAEAPVLRDITFSSAAGMTTAIIGSTGAGKSTLLNLIPRIMDVTAGQIAVGGTDVRELDLDELRSRIAVIPQRPFLFSGTIESNLRFGNPEATEEQLWRALRIAQAEDFVQELDDQLQAEVQQGGTNFSGGQRQRLAIARAVVREADVFLFDDSFSALDLVTDARLRAALREVTQEANVIVVAQRISTIAEADQIIVLDEGAVVGIGKHDDLLESCPTYAEIAASQRALEGAT